MSNLAATAVIPSPAESETGALTQRLRAAIRSEAYEDVLGLLAEYNCRFEQALNDASGDLTETKRIATEARELFDWARATVSANRAHTQASLSRTHRAAQYMNARESASRTWQVEA